MHFLAVRSIICLLYTSRHSKTFLLLGGKDTGRHFYETLLEYGLENVQVHVGRQMSYEEMCIRDRCYARVLSVLPSVMQSIDLGFSGKHLIAMQGPFSREMNLALLHQTEAKYFVTKESGKNGGFAEKLEAAEQAGAVLLVIGRPIEEGLSLIHI